MWTRTLLAIEVHDSDDYFSYSLYFFFYCDSGFNRCHNLLYVRCNSEHGVQRRTGSTSDLRVMLCRVWTQWCQLALSYHCSSLGLHIIGL